MSENIIVNNTEIEKEVIKKFLIQNKKSEAVKYICDQAGIGLASAQHIVALFEDDEIDQYDGKDLVSAEMPSVSLKNSLNERSGFSRIKKIVGLLILVIVGILVYDTFIGNSKEAIWYKVQQYVTYTDEDWENYNNNKKMMLENPSTFESNTVVLGYAQESPTDTLIWENAIKNGDYIPQGVLEEVKRYKNRDFSKLVVAADQPTDKEAEEAIVRNYKSEVVEILKQNKAHIRIGRSYNAPLQNTGDHNPEIARVTAMVSGFNEETGNLGNIQSPIDIVYDFVKFQSDPTTWYLSDFSQSIPYDYQLNKDRW